MTPAYVDPEVTLFVDRTGIRSYPKYSEDELRSSNQYGFNVPLSDVLTGRCKFDGHIVQYRSPNELRLGSDAVDHFDKILMSIVIHDFDYPRKPEPPTRQWRTAFQRKMEAMAEVHGMPFWCESLNGARAYWLLEQPFAIDSREAALDWTRSYLVVCESIERRFGLSADRACKDWTRFQRIPHGTRKGELQELPTYGDPHNVATLMLDDEHISRTDIRKAKKQCRSHVYIAPEVEGAAAVGDGRGVLYHLLRNRSYLGRRQRDGSWIIRCPNEENHSSGRTGDTSTVLYPPHATQPMGWIHCKHAHCHGFGWRDWLEMFSSDEIERAREAAGVTSNRTVVTP